MQTSPSNGLVRGPVRYHTCSKVQSPCHLHLPDPSHAARHPTERPPSPPASRALRHSDRDARAGDRRQHGDLQPARHGRSAPASLSGCRPAAPDRLRRHRPSRLAADLLAAVPDAGGAERRDGRRHRVLRGLVRTDRKGPAGGADRRAGDRIVFRRLGRAADPRADLHRRGREGGRRRRGAALRKLLAETLRRRPRHRRQARRHRRPADDRHRRAARRPAFPVQRGPDLAAAPGQRHVHEPRDAGEGRLRPRVSPAAVRRDLLRISASYRETFPDRLDTVFPLTSRPLDEHLIGSARGNLLMLLAGVGLVLLIACADVANLLLADGLARRREIAVAVALGAGRRRIFAQAVRESLLLAAAGGALGVLLAAGGLRLLVAAQSAGQSADLPRLDDVALSGRALAFAVLVTAVSGLLAGLAPAWQKLRTDPKSFLSAGERGAAGGRRSGWAQGLLVTVQVALALVLLSASGLLLRSLHRVNGVPLGFDPAGLQFVEITLPEAKYPSAAARRACFEQLVDRVRQIPGVQSAALVDRAPTTSASHFRMRLEGGPPEPAEKQPLVLLTFAGDGYFTTLRTRLLAGHDFDPGIAASAPLSAIVNRSFRDRYFSGQSPLGRRLELSGVPAAVEIIGVVEDIQQTAM